MDIDRKDALLIDLLSYPGGLPEALAVMAKAARQTAEREARGTADYTKVAEALQVLADRVAEFEEHYGSREP